MRLSSLPLGGLRGTGLSICAILSMLLLPPTAVAEKSAGDYFVHSLPGAPEGPLLKMHAGYGLPRCLPVSLLITRPAASSKSTQNITAIYSFGTIKTGTLQIGSGR